MRLRRWTHAPMNGALPQDERQQHLRRNALDRLRAEAAMARHQQQACQHRRTGVSTRPNTLDTDALHSAAATLPRAIEVMAMADCTVEGSKPMNSRPAARVGSSLRPSAVVSASRTAGTGGKCCRAPGIAGASAQSFDHHDRGQPHAVKEQQQCHGTEHGGAGDRRAISMRRETVASARVPSSSRR